MDLPAAAGDRVLVVLGDRDRDQRDLGLLVAVDDSQVDRLGQRGPADAHALGEPVDRLVRGVGERQMRARRALLPARGPLLATPAAAVALLRYRPARLAVLRPRHR
ncbi:hypothetical protein [Frankia sp. CiP3]|uniref:hypothetical protein n=1 Tax=Frankia sp. CiP3 TaxID=2880971 RepID=UPI001EF5F7D2|nr:hypothetical protein [Frankia sp. CiP3]